MAGIVSIRLELRADNAATLSFYRRLGFTETQLVPGYYEGMSRRAGCCCRVQMRREPPIERHFPARLIGVARAG